MAATLSLWRLNRGGYDRHGRYFGNAEGTRLWRLDCDRDGCLIIRATSREDALGKAAKMIDPGERLRGICWVTVGGRLEPRLL